MILMFGFFSFKEATRTGDSATCPDSGDEMRDLSFRLFPDLRAGGAVVRLRVGWM